MDEMDERGRSKTRRRRLLGGLPVLVGAAALVFSLSACGGSPSATSSGNTGTASTNSSSKSSTTGGSSSSDTGGSTTAGNSGSASTDSASQEALEFVSCVRKHGVPNFPDSAIRTNAAGGIGFSIPSNLGVSSAQLQSAMSACQSLLPSGGRSGSNSSANAQALLKFVNCMHNNGVPNFPEPNSNGQEVVQGGANGINANSPTFQKAQQTCRHLLPSGGQGGATAGG